MSLPTISALIANGMVVAEIQSPSENNPWSFEAIIRECFIIHNKCLEQQKFELTSPDKAFYAVITDMWHSYDHVMVLDYIIPRSAMNDLFTGKITEPELVQRFKDGSYRKNKCSWIKDVNYKLFKERSDLKYAISRY